MAMQQPQRLRRFQQAPQKRPRDLLQRRRMHGDWPVMTGRHFQKRPQKRPRDPPQWGRMHGGLPVMTGASAPLSLQKQTLQS